MYSANALGNGYEAADLPNAVTVKWTGRFIGSMAKSGSGYAAEGAALQVTDGVWTLSDSSGTRTVGQCLIQGDGNLTGGDDLIEDQFVYAYNVEFLDKTVTVFRESLCTWFGEQDIGGFLYEVNLGYNDITNKWEAGFTTVDIGSENTDKDESQNTPVGTYTGEFATITVSQA